MSWLSSAPALYTAFAGTLVEFIEALTIVLAVGTTRGWRGALGGAGLATGFLLLLLAGLGSGITRIPLQPLRVALGALTLLFGMRWLRKAMLRSAGVIPLRDERAAYGRQLAASASGPRRTLWDRDALGTTFRVTVIEGVEAIFIVLATGAAAPGAMAPAVIGAAAALFLVCLLGVLLRRPIAAIPDNPLKLGIGICLCALATFWLGEGEALSWPGGDWSLPGLLAGFALAAATGIATGRVLHRPSALASRDRSSTGRQGWWPLRKARRLFFDDWRLSVPTLAWLALSPVLRHLGLAPAWRAIALFAGLAAILVGATVAALRPRRATDRQEQARRVPAAGPAGPAVRPGS